MERGAQPGQVLLVDRLVQAQLGIQLGDRLRRCVGSQDVVRDGNTGAVGEKEGNRSDDKDQDEALAEAPKNVHDH